jgi:hypothetical protein
MSAICGTSASITVGSLLNDAHGFTLNWATNEQDVRVFGSGTFGDWLACTSNGTLTINTYEPIAYDPGDAVTFSLVLGGGHTGSGTGVMTTFNVAVDAKGLVEYVYTIRIDGTLTIA